MGSCLTMLAAPADMLPIQSVFSTEQELTRLLSSSSDATSNGLDVQVGRSIDAQTIHIPKSALNSCPVLKNLFVPGCRITNADPTVLAIIVEHLKNVGFFGLVSFSVSGHLRELPLSDDPLLNFAKAWHIGDMLRMPDIQNAITKIYSAYYTECLENCLNLSTPLEPISSQPFTYLRDNIGYHTKAERFLVDFYAGLAKSQSKLKRSEHKLLPADIALRIRDRWKQLRGRHDSAQVTLSDDRIIARDPCFKVSKTEKVIHGTLQVQYLCAGAGTSFGFNPPVPVVHGQRKASRGSRSSVSQGGSQSRLEGLVVRRKRPRDARSRSGSRTRLSRGRVEKNQEAGAQPKFTAPFDSADAQM